jgi:dTDP-4-dehydrorhamnose reductase
MMKVLVLGANGQVGSELVIHGKKKGLQMIAANHKQLDISQSPDVDEFISEAKPDLVINAAAYTAVDKAEQESSAAYAANRDGPLNLALACERNNTPLFHISTDYVFDGLTSTPYKEDDEANPKSVYGKSKREGEKAIIDNTGKYLILRVAWVFGARGHNFVHTILRLAAEREVLKIVSDQFGSPTWSVDIANVLLDIAQRYFNENKLQWGTYHYIGAPVTSWCEFAKVIIDKAHRLGMLDDLPRVKPIATSEYPTPASRPQNSVLDCQKICREFSIQQPDWQKGLAAVLRDIQAAA